MIKVFEAFAGIGTQKMALRNLEIEHEVVAISEIDKFAIKSYEAIHGEVNNLGDISKVKIEDIPNRDLFTYSFPCQDISVAGDGKGFEKGSGTRSSLLWECEKIIKEKRPKYLLMENVKALVNKKNKPHFYEWLKLLESIGYSNYWDILNAKDYGIPQNRERVFCVSILDDNQGYKFPEPFELELRLKDLLEDEVDEKYYLSDEQVDRIKFSDFNQEKHRIQDKEYCDTLLSRDYKGPKCIKVGDFRYDEGLRIRKNGLSPCLTTKIGSTSLSGNTLLIKNSTIRKLTPKECWRLMGCSDEDFYKAEKVNSNTQLYKQAGNAIVVNVLEHIFYQLFKKN